MDWKQELLKRLDALAGQLGTTAGYLWHVMVRQAYIEGITDCVLAMLFTVVTITGYRLTRRALEIPNKSDSYQGEYWPDKKQGLFWPSIVVGSLAAIFSLVSLTFGIQELLNPEYFALRGLVEKLTGN